MPKVSVIIPVYNAEKYLRKCLDSVVNQTLKDIEIICINDGSTDGSLAILNEYATRDDRIKVITQVNSGSAAARNAGIGLTKGDYIGFLDSDDYISLNYYEELYKSASENNADISATCQIKICENDTCISKYSGISEHSILITKFEDKAKIIKTTGVSWNKIYKTKFLKSYNINCLEINNPAEDNYFTDLAIICANKIAVNNNAIYYYVMHNESQTQHLKTEADFAIFDVYEKIEDKISELNLDEKTKSEWINVISERKHTDADIFYKTMDFAFKKKFKELALKKLKESIIISLTSYPKRIKTVHFVVESLLKQSLFVDRVVLWLAEEEFPNKEDDLPQELINLSDNNISFCIKWCENIKPYKKLIPSLKEFPNSIIITFDDDVIYDSGCAKTLYDAHLKFPNDIIGNRGHYITFNKRCKINPYKQWITETKHKRASYNCLLTGVGGILYPPNCFYKDILNKDLFETLAYNTDDLWFWAMGVLNGTKFRVCRRSPMKLNYVKNTQSCALYVHNVQASNNNDKNLENIFSTYPELYKKLTKYYPIEKNLQNVFSITNSGTHKVITIFGIKLKLKSKKLIERIRINEQNACISVNNIKNRSERINNVQD